MRGKGKDIVEVSFSGETAVEEVFRRLEHHCVENSQKAVGRLHLATTKVRLRILEKIGNQVFNGDSALFTVAMDKFQPHLFVKKEDSSTTDFHSKHTFSNAIMTFSEHVTSIDFSDCKRMCLLHHLKNDDLKQFIVLGKKIGTYLKTNQFI